MLNKLNKNASNVPINRTYTQSNHWILRQDEYEKLSGQQLHNHLVSCWVGSFPTLMLLKAFTHLFFMLPPPMVEVANCFRSEAQPELFGPPVTELQLGSTFDANISFWKIKMINITKKFHYFFWGGGLAEIIVSKSQANDQNIFY